MRSITDLGFPARSRRAAEGPVRPVLAGLPQLVLAALVLVVGFAASIEWPWPLAVACSLVLVALIQIGRAALELARRRRAADRWLLWGATARPSSALLSWRAAELTSPRVRAILANSLGRTEREACGPTLPGPLPLNRRAIRSNAGLLRMLTGRLRDRDRPVAVRGMLLVDRLVTEPGSPLYSYLPDDVLAEALSEALAALEAVPLEPVALAA